MKDDYFCYYAYELDGVIWGLGKTALDAAIDANDSLDSFVTEEERQTVFERMNIYSCSKEFYDFVEDLGGQLEFTKYRSLVLLPKELNIFDLDLS